MKFGALKLLTLKPFILSNSYSLNIARESLKGKDQKVRIDRSPGKMEYECVSNCKCDWSRGESCDWCNGGWEYNGNDPNYEYCGCTISKKYVCNLKF